MNRFRTCLLGLALVLNLLAMAQFLGADDTRGVSAFNRGRDAFDHGDLITARAEFEKSYKQQPRPEAAYCLGLISMKLSKFDQASMWANTALRPYASYTLDEKYKIAARAILTYSEKMRIEASRTNRTQAPTDIEIIGKADTYRPEPPGIPNQLPSIEEIRIESATYGANCGAAQGNATKDVSLSCNGKSVCKYVIDCTVLGDPVPGCVKDYDVTFACAVDRDKKSAHVGDEEAGFQKVVILTCP
jgi:hypothetical protein